MCCLTSGKFLNISKAHLPYQWNKATARTLPIKCYWRLKEIIRAKHFAPWSVHGHSKSSINVVRKAIHVWSQPFPSTSISRQAKPKGVQGFHIINLSVQALCSHGSFNSILSKYIFGRAPLILSFAKVPFLVHSKYLAIEHGLPPFIPTARDSRIWLENMHITPILISREQNRPTPHLSVPLKRGAVPQCPFKRYAVVMEPSFTNTHKSKSLYVLTRRSQF